MDTPNIQPGTVIHGTMRPQDLIPAFVAEFARIDPDAAAKFIGEWRAVMANPGHEDAGECVDALFAALDDRAPEGLTFSAIEGDGSDYGWWEDPDYVSEETQQAQLRATHELESALTNLLRACGGDEISAGEWEHEAWKVARANWDSAMHEVTFTLKAAVSEETFASIREGVGANEVMTILQDSFPGVEIVSVD